MQQNDFFVLYYWIIINDASLCKMHVEVRLILTTLYTVLYKVVNIKIYLKYNISNFINRRFSM